MLLEDSELFFTEDWASHHFPAWRDVLSRYVGLPGVRGLEIGSFEGRSARFWLSEILTGEGSFLQCVDSPCSDRHKVRLEANLRDYAYGAKVGIMLDDSAIGLPRLIDHQRAAGNGPMFDFAYIDGSHHRLDVLRDGLNVLRLLKPGGTIIFDDYLWWPGYPLLADPVAVAPGCPGEGIDTFLRIARHEIDRAFEISNGWQVVVRTLI